ncbi:uncharacterized protein LOC114803981 [Zeugodacus cucurbitae]|uniref:uncharacterized protein LOC114803981 n=1 Tax=Zeugodacus cucurbitae TaxID=28588 RepID=UPI0023D9054B|nr:uncharacterized protein LOC114803981 [Zeugodacus cucurbitae]
MHVGAIKKICRKSSNAVDYVRAGDSKQEISFFLPRHFNSICEAGSRSPISLLPSSYNTPAEAAALVLVQLGRERAVRPTTNRQEKQYGGCLHYAHSFLLRTFEIKLHYSRICHAVHTRSAAKTRLNFSAALQ